MLSLFSFIDGRDGRAQQSEPPSAALQIQIKVKVNYLTRWYGDKATHHGPPQLPPSTFEAHQRMMIL